MGLRRAQAARTTAQELVDEASNRGHDLSGMPRLPRPPGAFLSLRLDAGLHLWAVDLEAAPALPVAARYGCPVFCSLCVEGDWSCAMPGADTTQRLQGGDIGLYALRPEQVWTHRPESGGRLCSLGVELEATWLAHLGIEAEALAERVRGYIEASPQLRLGRATHALRTRATQVFKLDPTQGLDRLRLQALALDLVTECLSLLGEDAEAGSYARAPPMPSAQRKRLEVARRLMDQRFAETWTLDTLAAAAGLTEKRLTEGFTQAFGLTVFGYLQSLRMHRAHELLLGGMRVTEVTYEVGYAHVGSFSRAFSGHFGVSPGRVLRCQRA